MAQYSNLAPTIPSLKFRDDRYESDAIENYELGYKASLGR